MIRRSLFAALVCLSLPLAGCGPQDSNDEPEDADSSVPTPNIERGDGEDSSSDGREDATGPVFPPPADDGSVAPLDGGSIDPPTADGGAPPATDGDTEPPADTDEGDGELPGLGGALWRGFRGGLEGANDPDESEKP